MSKSLEKAIAAGLEPIADSIVDAEKRIDDLEQREPVIGPEGKPGKDGRDGLGIKCVEVEPDNSAWWLIFDNDEKVRIEQPVPQVGEKGDPGARGDAGVPGEPGPAGIGIKMVEQASDCKTADFVFDNGETVTLELPVGPEGKPGEKGLDGQPGQDGEDGVDGEDGADGAGIHVKLFEPGEIYRRHAHVMYGLGKIAKALKDTNQPPGAGRSDWERVGTFGQEFKGVRQADADYEVGDLVIDKGSLFLYNGKEFKMVVQRGQNGKTGRPGEDALQIVGGAWTEKGLEVVFDDGSHQVWTAPVLDTVQRALTEQAEVVEKLIFAMGLDQDDSVDSVPILRFRGDWIPTEDYRKGDVAGWNKAVWIAFAKPEKGKIPGKAWTRFSSSGGGGGSVGSSTNVVSPFNVVALNLAIPPAGGGNGDTYFSFQDKLLHIWDDTNKKWIIPEAVAETFPTDAGALQGTGVPGQLRWAVAEKILRVWDGTAWAKSTGGIKHVADAAARNAYTAEFVGDLVSQEDDGTLWRWMPMPGGGPAQWFPVAPNPPDNGAKRRLEWDPSKPDRITWADDRLALAVVPTVADMNGLPQSQLARGKLIYVMNTKDLYELVDDPTQIQPGGASFQKVVQAVVPVGMSNTPGVLPQFTGANPPRIGELRFVTRYQDGQPYEQLFVAAVDPATGNPAWLPVSRSVKVITSGSADTAATDSNTGDIQLATSAQVRLNHRSIKVFNNGVWETAFNEDLIANAIAAGNLFTGTVQDKGHGTFGAISIELMPPESSLSANNKGHYWVWVGKVGFVIGDTTNAQVITDTGIGGATSNVDGQRLSAGDWIQVAETTPGTFQYTVIPGDLLSKARADALYSLGVWSDAAYELGSLVNHNGGLYKARLAIKVGDLAPDMANSKWDRIPLQGGFHSVATRQQLPATGAQGELYLITNDNQANNNPTLVTYDNPSAMWRPVAGGGGASAVALPGSGAVTPMNFNGGKMIEHVGVPVGTVLMYPGDVIPDGFLRCDGATFSKTAYPLLDKMLGDNTTPDLTGQFIRGAPTGRLDNLVKHKHTTALPTIPFTGTAKEDGQHDHKSNVTGFRGSDPNEVTWGAQNHNGHDSHVDPAGKHTHDVTIDGGGDAETAPDHVLLHFVIKARSTGMVLETI